MTNVDIKKWDVFSATFALSEHYLNTVMETAYILGNEDGGKMPDKFVYPADGKKSALNMDVDIGPPKISLKFHNAAEQQAKVVVPILRGKITYKRFDPEKDELETVEIPAEGSQFSYVANLDIGGASEAKLAIRKEIQEQVNNWNDSMFDPLYMYMNFEDSATILDGFKFEIGDKDKLSFDPDTDVELQKSVNAFGKVIIAAKKENNEFVFGACKVNKVDTRNTDGLNFSGATIIVSRLSDDEHQRTVNYLFVREKSRSAPSGKRFDFKDGDYFTSKDIPCAFYFKKDLFLSFIQDQVLHAVKKKNKSFKKHGNDKLKGETGDADAVISLTINPNTNELDIKLRADGEYKTKLIGISVHTVKYWQEKINRMKFHMEGTDGEINITSKKIKDKTGDNRNAGDDAIDLISKIGSIVMPISNIWQSLTDSGFFDDQEKKVTTIPGLQNFEIADTIALPGRSKLFYKAFKFNKHQTATLQTTFKQ